MSLRNSLKTTCGRGHELSGDNVRVYDGKRQCVVCQRGYQRIRAGWPIEMAFTTDKQKLGQRPKGIGKKWAERNAPTLKPPKPIMQRFMDNVAMAPGCWEWHGPMSECNYGRFFYKGRNWKAHRVAYELMVGPIPEGMFILHSCDNPKCVNPLHLRPGTAADNMADAKSKGHLQGNKGHRYLTETAQ